MRTRRASADPIIFDAVAEIAVSLSGETAIFSEDPGTLSIQIYDRFGKLKGTINHRGNGPGEFMRLGFLGFEDSTLLVVAPGRPALLRFKSDGRFDGETRLDGTTLTAMGIQGDTIDVVRYGRDGFAGIALEPVGSQRARPFLSTSDTFLATAARPLVGTSLRRPAYARAGGFTIVGNGYTYRLGVYRADGTLLGTFGRNLPPDGRGPRGVAELRDALALGISTPGLGGAPLRARLDTLDREVVAHFGRGGLALDAKRRIWVVGRRGDSTFADVFADTTFLGRHVLPCFRSTGGFALNGTFIALRCANDGYDGFHLELYQITD
jgi:hypothetical protein